MPHVPLYASRCMTPASRCLAIALCCMSAHGLAWLHGTQSQPEARAVGPPPPHTIQRCHGCLGISERGHAFCSSVVPSVSSPNEAVPCQRLVLNTRDEGTEPQH